MLKPSSLVSYGMPKLQAMLDAFHRTHTGYCDSPIGITTCTHRSSAMRGTLQHPFLLRFFRSNTLRKCIESISKSGFWLLWKPICIMSMSVRVNPAISLDSLLFQDLEQAYFGEIIPIHSLLEFLQEFYRYKALRAFCSLHRGVSIQANGLILRCCRGWIEESILAIDRIQWDSWWFHQCTLKVGCCIIGVRRGLGFPVRSRVGIYRELWVICIYQPQSFRGV